MKINVALVLRLDETVVKEFDNEQGLTDCTEYVENLQDENLDFFDKYRLQVIFTLKDGEYTKDDYIGDVFDLEKIDEASQDINSLSEMYVYIDEQEEIPAIWEYMDNDCEELQYHFSDITTFIKAVQYGDYNVHDKYVKFNGYGNLVTTNYIPYQDYEIEIFEQWLKENI